MGVATVSWVVLRVGGCSWLVGIVWGGVRWLETGRAGTLLSGMSFGFSLLDRIVFWSLTVCLGFTGVWLIVTAKWVVGNFCWLGTRCYAT